MESSYALIAPIWVHEHRRLAVVPHTRGHGEVQGPRASEGPSGDEHIGRPSPASAEVFGPWLGRLPSPAHWRVRARRPPLRPTMVRGRGEEPNLLLLGAEASLLGGIMDVITERVVPARAVARARAHERVIPEPVHDASASGASESTGCTGSQSLRAMVIRNDGGSSLRSPSVGSAVIQAPAPRMVCRLRCCR